MNLRPPIRSLFAVIVLVLGPWATATAQVKVELAPYVGVYLPQDRLTPIQGITASGGSAPLPSLKQQSGITLGSRLDVWLIDHVGMEGTLSYAPSSLAKESGNFFPGLYPTGAHVITGSARAIARTSPPGAAFAALQVSGGMGFVSLGGPAYGGTSGTTFFSTVVSAAAMFRVSRSFALRLEAEDYLYRANLEPCGNPEFPSVCNQMQGFISTGSKAQNDLVLSLGLAMPLARD
jgi:hypothetical protein